MTNEDHRTSASTRNVDAGQKSCENSATFSPAPIRSLADGAALRPITTGVRETQTNKLKKGGSMNQEKTKLWIQRLKAFSINSSVHCSREELAVGQELLGTRHVNMAFSYMLMDMEMDFELPQPSIVVPHEVFKGGQQFLAFQVERENLLIPLHIIHEVVKVNADNTSFKWTKKGRSIGLFNWYEGLVPIMDTKQFLSSEAKTILSELTGMQIIVVDVQKELFALLVDDVLQKVEVPPNGDSAAKSIIDLGGELFSVFNVDIHHKDFVAAKKLLFEQAIL